MASVLIDATAPMGGVVDAAALPEMMAKQRQMQNKKMAYIPDVVKQTGRDNSVFIFNISSKPIMVDGASYGRFTIPRCEPGEAYSKPLQISGVPYEPYNMMGDVLDPQYHRPVYDGDSPGYDFACQLIMGYTEPSGEWKGQSMIADQSLERFGLGICMKWPPTEAEVAAAKMKRQKTMAKLVAQANEANALGQFREMQTPDHFIAAAELGKTSKECPWLQFSGIENMPAETKPTCPNCGESHNPGIARHSCGFVLNVELYNEYVLSGRLQGELIGEPTKKKQ